MKKEDIKTGSIVELRKGTKCILIGHHFIDLEYDNDSILLNYYDENFNADNGACSLTELDIMKVWQSTPEFIGDSLSYYIREQLEDLAPQWKRKELFNLSDVERVILENVKLASLSYLVRKDEVLYITFKSSYKDWEKKEYLDNKEMEFNFLHLFQFIKNEEIYSIKELLGCK